MRRGINEHQFAVTPECSSAICYGLLPTADSGGFLRGPQVFASQQAGVLGGTPTKCISLALVLLPRRSPARRPSTRRDALLPTARRWRREGELCLGTRNSEISAPLLKHHRGFMIRALNPFCRRSKSNPPPICLR